MKSFFGADITRFLKGFRRRVLHARAPLAKGAEGVE